MATTPKVQPPKISSDLKARLMGQKKAMSAGMMIDNKSFTKGTFRFLRNPNLDELGFEYHSWYCARINKGSTSPITFGLLCPLNDYAENLKLSGSKEEKDAFYNSVNRAHEYWMPCIDVADLGTALRPNVRILRGKQVVYVAVVNRMTDEDHGEDVTDLRLGRNAAISKTGQKLDTVWNTLFLDREPVCDDEEFIVALEAAMENFDTPSKMYKVDWDNIAEIYLEVTGQDMPESYREQAGAEPAAADDTVSSSNTGIPPKATAKVATAAPKAAPKAVSKPAPKAAPKPVEPESAVDENGVEVGVTRASFEVDGTTYAGLLTVRNEDDEDGVASYDFLDDSDQQVWTVKAGEFEIIEAVAEEEAPAPAPAPAKKGPQPKVAPTPAAPAKVGVAKPTTVKPVTRVTGSASSAIKARLHTK